MNPMDMTGMTPAQTRLLIREGAMTAPTSGLCPGYAQANLVVLPKEYAYDFLLYAQRNPKACSILEVSDVGSQLLKKIAPGADIARDIPRYRIYEKGVLREERTAVADLWRDDLVSFLIGCSFSFESELIEAGIEMRHNTLGCNVPMYLTNIPCESAGMFHGNMVVSMRPIPYGQIVKSVTVTAAIPKVHGALYNMAGKDYALARAICEAIAEINPQLILMAQAGSQMEKAAKDLQLPMAREIFADRAYEEDGSLVARSKPGAMITDEDEAIRRVITMFCEGKVQAVTGKEIPIQADSVCVHGDGAKALLFVKKLREAFAAEGIAVHALR